jgi:hypothetical protein
VAGVEYLMDPETPDRLRAHRRQARTVFLLPGFDEYMLGYGDRSAALAAEFATHIVPGNNGIFKPTVVADAQVVGTWKPHAGGVRATPFSTFTPALEAAITQAAQHLPPPISRRQPGPG